MAPSSLWLTMECPMPQQNELSSPSSPDQDSKIIAVVEMSQSSWLVAGMLPA